MAELVGTRDDFALFSEGDLAVFVRMSSLDVFDPQPLVALSVEEWSQNHDPASVPTDAWELAEIALTTAKHVDGTDVLIAAGERDKRSFAVPKAVQAEAKKALAWRKEFKRGGTDVGLNTARTLAKGESVGITKIRHIAKYFPRHEVDKAGAGWSPGEDGFPSNGRIAWALWGGDPAWRWAKRIVERDDARTKTASTLASAQEVQEAVKEVPEDVDDVVAAVDEPNRRQPHVYVPDPSDNYACDVCGGYEFGLVHIDPEDDAPNQMDVEPMVAAAIEHLEREGIETLASIRDRGIVETVYSTDPRTDDWWKWDTREVVWKELSTQPADVIEFDLDTAKLAIEKSVGSTPLQTLESLVRDEAALVYDALPSLGDYVQTEIHYYTSSAHSGTPSVYAYSGDTGDIWIWDKTSNSWQETAQMLDMLTEVSEDKARAEVLAQRESTTSVNDIQMEFDRVEYFGSYSMFDRIDGAVAYVKGLSTLIASTHALQDESGNEAKTTKPTYAAVVDDYDNDVVLALIAIIPKIGDNPPQVLTRKEGSWTPDQTMFLELQSATPPTLVTLDDNALARVQRQVDFYYRERAKGGKANAPDEETTASIITAAGIPGIADTPSDIRAARRLKRYWSRGPGAAKIVWGTPGDWRRCVRLLTKYMGTRSKGYCQNLHKSVTGIYTGDRRNPGRRRRRGLSIEGDVLLQVPPRVFSSPEEFDGSSDTVLASIGIPSVRDMQNLRTREAGHRIAAGERFLVNGGDGTYVLSVLPVGTTIGWQGQSAIIVDDPQRGTTVLRETEEG